MIIREAEPLSQYAWQFRYPGESDEPVASSSLLDLRPGESAMVAAIPEEDSAMVAYLAGLGLIPAAAITVDEIAPFNGPITLTVNGNRMAIGREAASRVRIRSRDSGIRGTVTANDRSPNPGIPNPGS
jgi:Fe2+ transport system protein FeoA